MNYGGYIVRLYLRQSGRKFKSHLFRQRGSSRGLLYNISFGLRASRPMRVNSGFLYLGVWWNWNTHRI